jgi:hypothetical protein
MKLCLVSFLAFLSVGCTTVLHDKAAQTSLIMSRGISLERIDDTPVSDGGLTRFEVEAGHHRVVTNLDATSTGAPSEEALERFRTACFKAEASHVYEVEAVDIREQTRAQVTDITGSRRKVDIHCEGAPDDAKADKDVRLAVLRARRREAKEEEERDVASSSSTHLPKVDIRVAVGDAMGGETMVSVDYRGNEETLLAGDGLTAMLSLSVTPFWIGDTIGFGLGGSVGWKYGSLSVADYSLSVSRTPVEAWLQIVFPLADKWLGTFAVGAHDDLDILTTESEGSTNTTIPTRSHIGFVSEFGLYRELTSHFGCGLNLRFVKVGYTLGYTGSSTEVDASNFGGEFTMHVFF